MNPYLYDEYKLSSRHAREHFRKTIGTGLAPIGIACWLWYSHFPHGGPGLYSVAGLGLAGLLMLWSARALHREPDVSRLSRWLVARSATWYPAFFIFCQNYFVALTVLLLWFTVCDLGFQASWLQHTLLLLLLALSPVRRILNGTEPAHPSPTRELVMEILRYVNTTVVAVFVAGCATIMMLPPDKPLLTQLPPGVILVWIATVLVIITCVVLLLDHILRKMPQPAQAEAKDALD